VADTVIFKLFGSVGLVKDGRLVAIQGGRQRTLLATLLINSGKVVTKEQFFEELWEGRPMAKANNALQALITRLRRLLRATFGDDFARERLVTLPTGYILHAETEEIDAKLFEYLVASAHSSVTTDPVRGTARFWRAWPVGRCATARCCTTRRAGWRPSRTSSTRASSRASRAA
jgi:DNA-binding SARP family transcriptional activator